MSELTENQPAAMREHLDASDAQSLLGALQEVSLEEREAIVLFHMQGFSLDEVSKMLNVNHNTLKSRIQRSLAFLRDKLRVTQPGLEAYLGTLVIPPPQGGYEAAFARWSRKASVQGPALPLAAKLIGVSAVVAVGLLGIWSFAALQFGEEVRQTARAATDAHQLGDSPDGGAAKRNIANAKAGSTPDSSPTSGPAGAGASAGPSEIPPEMPPAAKAKPREMVTPGIYRTRIKFYENGEIEAQWRELQRAHGLYTLDGDVLSFHPKGIIREIGQYSNNMRVGYWRSFHDNAALESRGEYCENLREGLWELFSKEELPLESGRFKADKRDGEWRIFFGDTGTIREVVTFANNLRHGQGVRYDKEGNITTETNWEAGKKHGIERVHGPNGIEEHEYSHGEPSTRRRDR